MSTLLSSRLLRLPRNQQFTDALPAFLVPSLVAPATPSSASAAHFSTTARQCKRDNNRQRGVSAIRHTGPRKRQTLSVKVEDLPTPVKKSAEPQIDESHGLWGFFNGKKTSLTTPDDLYSHGRAWAVEELRRKNWEDLHALWWQCCKERNWLATEAEERRRVKAGYGDYEADSRLEQIKLTQRAIKHTLTERWYAWEDARKVALQDPEVDLTGVRRAYTPADAYDVDAFEAEEVDMPAEELIEEIQPGDGKADGVGLSKPKSTLPPPTDSQPIPRPSRVV